MSEYGMIYDTSAIKQQLKEANRDYMGRKTWENLYAGIDIAEKQQIGALKQDYAKAMSEAYAAAYKNQQAIGASNIGQGYKVAAIDANDVALQEAYETYRQNYLKGKSEIEAASVKAESQIDEALTKQAKYTKKFANAPYEYLKDLFVKYSEGKDKDNIFLNNALWSRYVTDELDEEGNPTGKKRLLSWDELRKPTYDEYTDEFGNVQKEWTGLFDESGNLTIKGADFYDQMMNYEATHGGYSFGEWLANKDSDLYDWSQSYNPYNYTEAGTNAGSFNTMVGLTSTDQQYSFIERFGGISKKELDNMYSKFTDKASELAQKVNSDSGRGSKDILKEYEGLSKDIADLTEKLGIKEDIEREMGMSFDELGEYMYKLTSNALSNGDIWGETFKGAIGMGGTTAAGSAVALTAGAKLGAAGATTALTGAGLSTAGGFASAGASAGLSSAFTGAAASSSVPVVGWIVAAVIAAAAATYGAVDATEKAKTQNRQLAQAGKTAYTNLVTNLIEYSRAQQRQKQIDFYKRNK